MGYVAGNTSNKTNLWFKIQGRENFKTLGICDTLSSYSIWLCTVFSHCSGIPPINDPGFGSASFLLETHFKSKEVFFKSVAYLNITTLSKGGVVFYWEGGSRHWWWSLTLGPCYTKCGPWINTIISPGSLLEMQDLRSTPNLLSQKLHFNKILRGFMCTGNTKK